MATIVVVLCIIVALGLVVVWWRGRRGPRSGAALPGVAPSAERLFLLIYEGRNYELVPAEWVDEGKHELRPLGSEQGSMPYPRGAVHLLKRPGLTLGVVAFSQEVLAEHALMRRAREAVDLTSLFVGGGEPRRWLRWAGVVVPVIACLGIWFQLQGALSSQASVLQTVGAIQATVDSGLECRVDAQ